jgi:hypothetical protein
VWKWWRGKREKKMPIQPPLFEMYLVVFWCTLGSSFTNPSGLIREAFCSVLGMGMGKGRYSILPAK